MIKSIEKIEAFGIKLRLLGEAIARFVEEYEEIEEIMEVDDD